jgi:chromosomal replication initiator protein
MSLVTDAVRAERVEPQTILDALHERIGPQKYNAWFRHGTQLSVSDELVKVLVPNPFVANWIETHYQSEIAQAVSDKTGKRLPVLITVDASMSGELRRGQLDSQAAIVATAARGTGRSRPAQTASLRYRLEEFIVGESNRLAYSAATAVAAGNSAQFNPLFIHGPCGVGKTHLLQGICNAAGARGKTPVAWRYVTAEQFTNEFVSALRAKKLDEFRARFRKLDLLAIDDVHFLAAKKATQDEFLHTYNAIESAGKLVVMASDAHPRLVGELNEQLVSRFVAGMVVRISPPDHQTRVEVLRRRLEQLRLQAPPEVLEFVAQQVRGSVRELEGAATKLVALAALEGGHVTLELATQAMADHMARTESVVTLGDIVAAAAAFFGITPADIHSSRRTQTVSAARMVAMFLARRHTRMSFPEIGKCMGKNHSSVVLAVQRMEALLAGEGKLSWLASTGPKSSPAGRIVQLLSEQIERG